MKIKNKNWWFLILLIGILFMFSLVSATYAKSGTQYISPGSSFSSFGGSAEADCGEVGQDFIVQISPLGCEPTLVRSDLLEENNVPVFCQLGATKINPLIDVNAIEDIDFAGNYDKTQISGFGFHPAQAALGVSGDLNSPVLNNIGYAVIVLNQIVNESSLKNCEKDSLTGTDVCWVEGNLTATLKYDIENAFGIGKATYYLPELNNLEWNEMYGQYGFWNGRGYMRAENIDNEGATIIIYDDSRRVSSVSLDKGKTSENIFIPGFDCLAGLKLRLDDLVNPSERAKLNINGEVFELGQGEKFLDNKCTVKKIEKQGIVSKVTFNCKQDEGGGNIELRDSPRIKLDFPGANPEGYAVGDRLPLQDTEDPNKNIFLGFIGTDGDPDRTDSLYVRFAQVPPTYGESRLSEDMLNEVARYDSSDWEHQQGSILGKFLKSALKNSGTWLERFGQFLVKGTEITSRIKYSDRGSETESVYGTRVEIIGFADSENIKLGDLGDEKLTEYFDSAVGDFETVSTSFSEIVYPSGSNNPPLGEEALASKIKLFESLKQTRSLIDLCEDFKNMYPGSKKLDFELSICNNQRRLANSENSMAYVQVNGKTKKIVFEGVRSPTEDEFSVEISISGAAEGFPNKFKLQYGEEAYFSNEEYVKLTSLTDEYAEFDVSVKESAASEVFWKDTRTGRVKLGSTFFLGKDGKYGLRVDKINLEKVAKVTILPNIQRAQTEANFPFKIGIEKRSIQLTPAQTEKKIQDLDKSISAWKKRTETLGNVVSGMKKLCLGVGGILTVKNFLNNKDGKSIARNKVMRNSGGWYDECQKRVRAGEFSSVDSCLSANSDEIEEDVNSVYSNLKNHNDYMKELQEPYTDSSVFGDRVVKDGELTQGLLKNTEYMSSIRAGIESSFPNGVELQGRVVSADELMGRLDTGKVSVDDLADLHFYSQVGGSDVLNKVSQEKLKNILSDIYVNTESDVLRGTMASELGGVGKFTVDSYGDKDSVVGVYNGDTITAKQIDIGLEETKDGKVINYPVQLITYNAEKYLVLLSGDKANYLVEDIYKYEGVSNGVIKVGSEDDSLKTHFKSFRKFDEGSYDNSYELSLVKPYPVLRYFETEPYKGFPALVPFDLNHGWYVSVRQSLSLGGGIQAYDSSGKASSFYLCNVGENNKEEDRSGDDICELINLGTGQPYNQFPRLSKDEAKKLVNAAVDALQDAQNGYGAGVKEVSISTDYGSFTIRVGEPASNVPDIQCYDFMSASDCKLMFNVCDPVICPSSRCDLGGNYEVQDVIQTGIVGSIALCLPNYKEGIYVPICLSGVHAGLEGWLSVQEAHKACLEESLATGKQVGICDQINSIYMCEFWWKQAIPFSKMILPKALGFVFGQNVRGGGEYLGVQDSWKNAENSVNYFTQYYAKNSYDAFKARSMESVGTEACSAYASIQFPISGDFLDKLTEPDSPTQFSGKFDEIPLTSATNPSISQYKVFYHIYAGEDQGVYYQVYLTEGTESSYYQDTSYRRVVASGYLGAGETVSESPDFSAVSGYKQLCISVNGQEECGFKQVSTDFSLNYINDKYMEQQASQTSIKSESECISGTSSLYSMVNPNVQFGVEETINPSIYNRGLIRICSTESPGMGSDVKDGMNGSRWAEVGYCSEDRKIKCWLDTNSVKDIIKHKGIEGGVLEDVTANYLDILSREGNYSTEEEVDSEISRLGKDEGVFNSSVYKNASLLKLEEINNLIDKVFWDHQKGKLYLMRGEVFSDLAYKSFVNPYLNYLIEKTRLNAATSDEEDLGDEDLPVLTTNEEVIGDPESSLTNEDLLGKIKQDLLDKGYEAGVLEELSEDELLGLHEREYGVIEGRVNVGEIIKEEEMVAETGGYIVFELQDGTFANNPFFSFTNNEWRWSEDKEEWNSNSINNLPTGEIPKNSGGLGKVDSSFESLILRVKDKDYLGGLKELADAILLKEYGSDIYCGVFGSCAELHTKMVKMDDKKIFKIKERIRNKFIFFKFEPTRNQYFTDPENPIDTSRIGTWYWSDDGKNFNGFIQTNNPQDIIESSDGSDTDWEFYRKAIRQSSLYTLAGESDLYFGAAKIFGYNQKLSYEFEEKKFDEDKDKAEFLTFVEEGGQNGIISSKCKDFLEIVIDAANKYDLPDPLLLIALMDHESGCKLRGFNPLSEDAGLMQINLKWHCGQHGLPSDKNECKEILLNDPEKNIFVGAEILKDGYDQWKKGHLYKGCSGRNVMYYDWSAALRSYNGWGCYPGQDYYVENVLKKYRELSGKEAIVISISSQENSVSNPQAKTSSFDLKFEEESAGKLNLYQCGDEFYSSPITGNSVFDEAGASCVDTPLYIETSNLDGDNYLPVRVEKEYFDELGLSGGDTGASRDPILGEIFLGKDYELYQERIYTLEVLESLGLDKENFVEAFQVYNEIKSFSGTLRQVVINARDKGVRTDYGTLKCNCGDDDSCASYAYWINKYASEKNIDPLLMLSFMIQESSCDLSAENHGAYGLMQITEVAFGDSCLGVGGMADFSDVQGILKVDNNIQCGIELLEDKYNSYKNGVRESSVYKNNNDFKNIVDNCISLHPNYASYVGWEAAIRAYNGWGCGGGADLEYVERVTKINEFFDATYG